MPYLMRTLWFALLLLGAARVLNRRTMVGDKPYDFAVNVTYGTLAGSGILNLSLPVWATTLAIAGLTGFAWATNRAGSGSGWLAKLLVGTPTVLLRGGRPVAENLRRVHMSERDLLAKLRELKLAGFADVELAVLETDGRVGVVPRTAATGGPGAAPGTEDGREGTLPGGGPDDPSAPGAAAPPPDGAAGPIAVPAPARPDGPVPGTVPVTHVEQHFTASETVRDIVIGMSDGLTVPFALAAGLSGAVAGTHVIIVAGLAEIAAGSTAMGLGGYLAAKTDAEHYATERARERAELEDHPDEEESEVVGIFHDHGVGSEAAGRVARELRRRPESWLDFLMRFELGLERPDPRRAVASAATIAASYVAGGLVPLTPYFVLPRVASALPASVAVTLAALLVFGFVKGRYTGTRAVRGALQTVLVGGLAAGVAFTLARIIGH